MEDKKDDLVIIGIDPGNNLGVAIYTLDATTLEIIKIENIMLVLNNYIPDEGDGYDKMNGKLKHLQKSILAIMECYKPKAIGLETSFLNMKFPKAVIQLSQYLAIIESTTKKLIPDIKIFRYSPKYIKSKVDAGGDAKKNDMTSAISKIEEITKHIELSVMTEHEIDSTAIGYVMLKEIRSYKLVLLALGV